MRALTLNEMDFVAGGWGDPTKPAFNLDGKAFIDWLNSINRDLSAARDAEDARLGQHITGGVDMDNDGDVDMTDAYLFTKQRDEYMYRERHQTPGRDVLGAISSLVDQVQGDTPDPNGFEPRPVTPGS